MFVVLKWRADDPVLRKLKAVESVVAVASDAIEVVYEVGTCVMVEVVVAGDA